MALILNEETNELYLSLSSELRKEVDKQMKSMNIQVSNSIDNLALDVSTYIESNAGLSTSQTISNLEDLQKASGGMFADAVSGLTGAITDKTFTISEDIFFGGLKSEADFSERNDRMTWTAMLTNTCPSCLPLHGQSRYLSVWKSTGGVPNERNTVCTIRKGSSCHCLLIPSVNMPSKKEMRAPIKIQATRVRKAEKRRGKSYAKTTKVGFLGQINDPKSTISDLRKVKKIKGA